VQARSIELSDLRIRRGVHLARLERTGPVNDPDMILRVDRHADRRAQNPVIRQRLGPEGIDFKPRGDRSFRGRWILPSRRARHDEHKRHRK